MATSHESLPPRPRGAGSLTRMPPVRLASREELTAAARVAPLLRAAQELAAWAGKDRPVTADGDLTTDDAAGAAGTLDLSLDEVHAAWAIATGTGMVAVDRDQAGPGERFGLLTEGRPDEALDLWCAALTTVLGLENLDGLTTALYTAGRPVRLDALFEAYAAAVGALTHDPPDTGEPAAAPSPGLEPGLELLADLGAVELGADEDDDDEAGLTVTLSPIGLWAVRDRLQERGWRVPVLGGSADGGATGVLAVLADYDAEDGEAEIAAWLDRRSPERAAEELTEAASQGSPGLRGAAFAVMDRVGTAAVPTVRRALANPVLRPHAAVWLREHGVEAALSREDSAWLLVDLGAGLLEEAAPDDVVAELLPDLPPHAQAELVAGLWRVEHPAVTELLTTLSDHHPEPDVAKAARKAAFKARSKF
ncbi:MAG TPA: hypothetical protein VG268_16755 [Streptosporangiaceae bacterium]|nr:hypothetical protein [Streptosporangiaceae bacterium]